MATTKDDQNGGGSKAGACAECGAVFSGEQRYCIECGARRGELPPAIAARIASLLRLDRGRGKEDDGGVVEGKEEAEDSSGEESKKAADYMPSPRAAAFAVLGMLGLGVLLGSVTNQFAQSAGLPTILLEMPASAPVPPMEEPEEAASSEPAAETSSVPLAESPLPVAPLAEEPLPEAEPPVEPAPVPIEEEFPTGPPEVKHVFLVVLGEGGYEETFGEASQSKYLSRELPAQGELLPNYFAVTKGELANRIALLSGQGPTLETQADCPTYADIAPGTESVDGQVEGNGCIYPATVKTLPGQLTEKDLTWRAYVDQEEVAEGVPPASPPPPGCYVTPRNPFAYFHSILDSAECAEADVGLARLAKDLTLKPDKFPAFAYISPDPAKSEETLKTILPAIQESFAYKDGGLIVITSAQAPQEGEKADSSACCVYPDYLNLPPESEESPTGPVKETGGGGRVGALLISPFVEPGTSSETYFSHFSLLVTIEELFGLERIGYAAEPALAGFDETIFNAAG